MGIKEKFYDKKPDSGKPEPLKGNEPETKKVKVENKLLKTHGDKLINDKVAEKVSGLDQTKQPLKKGDSFNRAAMKFYPGS